MQVRDKHSSLFDPFASYEKLELSLNQQSLQLGWFLTQILRIYYDLRRTIVITFFQVKLFLLLQFVCSLKDIFFELNRV
jgi:hypothetical protein